MKRVFRHFSRAHLYIFFGFYLAFAGFTFLVLTRQSESDWRENWNMAATIGAVSGQLTGAIARQFQSCCWQLSLSLLPCCGAFLLAGFVFQLVPIPIRSIERPPSGCWRGVLGFSAGLLAE